MLNPWRQLFSRRSRRRDFAAPALQRNPIFIESRRPGWPWIAAGLLAVAGAAFVLLSPRFRITDVTVSGAVRLDPTSIRAAVNRQLNQGWIGLHWKRVVFLTPTDSIASSLRQSVQPLISLDEIAVERHGRHTLAVRIRERQANLIWQSSGRQFMLDDRGTILERAPTPLPPGLLTVLDRNNIPTSIGQPVVPPSLVAAIRSLNDALPKFAVPVAGYSTWPVSCLPEPTRPERSVIISNTNQSLNNQNANRSADVNRATKADDATSATCNLVELAVREPTLVVRTEEGWELRIDSSLNLEAQLAKLRIALVERLDSQRRQLEYVDVRFGDRVFYQ
ncbi:MAG: hypothetical protein HY421_00705 [Candidatus Kerfeldbacteria bacterium]|nr:hypothetical protein [Candidatus Kerfeldbacteria bacterium]